MVVRVVKDGAVCIREKLATAVNAANLSPEGSAVAVLGALGLTSTATAFQPAAPAMAAWGVALLLGQFALPFLLLILVGLLEIMRPGIVNDRWIGNTIRFAAPLLEDVEGLNLRTVQGRNSLDVTKLSVHALGHVLDVLDGVPRAVVVDHLAAAHFACLNHSILSLSAAQRAGPSCRCR